LTALALVLVTTGEGPAVASLTSTELALAERVDGVRAARGVPALDTRAGLSRVARGWAARMAREQRLRHNQRLGELVANWRYLGENVGYGPTWQDVHAALMNSPPHRANLLDRRFSEIGVGVVTRDGRVWVVEVFRRPSR
jgi:uncharacterized protein YkwD